MSKLSDKDNKTIILFFFFIPFQPAILSFHTDLIDIYHKSKNRFSNQRKIRYLKSLNAVTLLDNYYSYRILFHYDFKKLVLTFPGISGSSHQ